MPPNGAALNGGFPIQTYRTDWLGLYNRQALPQPFAAAGRMSQISLQEPFGVARRMTVDGRQ